MALYHLVLVAFIQGVTEFLPVSSSGHLILLPNLANLADQGQLIDVAVHVGTLGAVVLYFRTDVAALLRGFAGLLRGRIDSPQAWLALCLCVATVPLLILGLILKSTGLSEALRSVEVIAWTMLIFGLVLYWADTRFPQVKKVEHWTLKDAVVIGLWQMLALVPGTSRSGITITGARSLGYAREDAIRIAMLLSIPAIIAPGLLLGAEVAWTADATAAYDAALAALLAFLSALLTLWVMMHLARRMSFAPYVAYRVVLGLVLLYFAYG